jgi:hypothetical protein
VKVREQVYSVQILVSDTVDVSKAHLIHLPFGQNCLIVLLDITCVRRANAETSPNASMSWRAYSPSLALAIT